MRSRRRGFEAGHGRHTSAVHQHGLFVAGSAPAAQAGEAELLFHHLARKARELAELLAGQHTIPHLYAHASDSDGRRLLERHAQTSRGCTSPPPGSGSGRRPGKRK